MGRFIDLTGKRFGRLVVNKRVFTSENATMWECLCDCGNTVNVSGGNLKNGHTRSCGCFARECSSELLRTHGESHTRLYHLWQDMKKRCYNKNSKQYKYYGGRGITVCDEWKDYSRFAEWSLSNGYGDGLSIDRINVNGNYTPLNCRWVTIQEQANNKTTSFLVEYNGETKTLAEWSRIFSIHENTLTHRIVDLGWDPQKAFSTPPYGENNRYTVNGESLLLSQISKKYGKPLKLLWSRMKRGWTIERAIAE